MKEAIFYSCQLIIEARGRRGRGTGGAYSSTSKGSGGEEDGGDGGMEGFEVGRWLKEEADGALRGELFYILNVLLFSPLSLSLSLSLSLWYILVWFSSLPLKSKFFFSSFQFTMLLLMFERPVSMASCTCVL